VRNHHRRRANQLRFRAGARGLGATIAAGELLDAARRVDELLLTCEKRMAGSADANFDVAPRRAGMINRAARADDIGFLIFRMDARFHVQKRVPNVGALSLARKR
jgi:hypothetical protein